MNEPKAPAADANASKPPANTVHKGESGTPLAIERTGLTGVEDHWRGDRSLLSGDDHW